MRIFCNTRILSRFARRRQGKRIIKAIRLLRRDLKDTTPSFARNAYADSLLTKLPTSALSQLKRVFTSLDVDENGYIDSDEMFELGKALKPRWNRRNNDRLMRLMDQNSDSKVSPEEFYFFILSILIEAFHAFDVDGNGSIDVVELIPVR